ncbi:hypothetical protein VTJ83DRAFT_2575 [Remersonia thermophila]|uniref:Nonsense-mediated mRNA decay factor n=1 Tax=Remersonia thermophila TaxID=72144 RepID=A0ABR4DJ31_9PEZI
MASTGSTTAGTAPAAAMPSANDTWKVAQKLRAAIQKELDLIKTAEPGTTEMARFEKVEKLMENYRLACIQTIWTDLRTALEKGAEDALWNTHTLVTQAYRRVLSTLHASDNVVLRRKLEKVYANYLKTSQYFYRGYLQRVCARYDMKDLKRIANGAGIEEMIVPDKDKVDAAASKLEDAVRESCHMTLIYLGDLARYRTLLRSKDRKWENALTYYSLASELMPESGFGYHQSGVIYLETESHLEVIYHLYRSLACPRPHPNASRNLDREFRELLKNKPLPTKHALLTWFVKLHAFYHQGKEFTERKELETEVDHRLALAIRTGSGYESETDLLKVVLINIAAYIAALKKLNKKWTEEGSRTCQFILVRNLRTIHVIADLLSREAADLIKRRSAETPTGTDKSSAQGDTATSFTPAFSRALPLLRIYMAWLCSYAATLMTFRPHLEPQFGAMSATLSATLSLLFELLGSEPPLGTPVSWRFPEDEMTLSIECLNGPNMSDGCQLSYDAFTRKPKPRREDVPTANDATENDINFTRALDIILCALDISDAKSVFPFTTTTVTKGSRELTRFVYLENGKPAAAQPEPAQPQPAQRAPAEQPPAAAPVPAAVERVVKPPMPAPSPCESNELSEDNEFYGPNLRRGSRAGARNGTGPSQPLAVTVQQPPVAAAAPTQAVPTAEFPIEKQLFNILNDFINPPEAALVPEPKTPMRHPSHASPYGMDSSGVAQAFRTSTSMSPAPGSDGAKAFPGLPWNYFYNPEPVGSALRNPSIGGPQPGWGGAGDAGLRPSSSGHAAVQAPVSGLPTSQAHRRTDSSGFSRPLDDQVQALRNLDLGSNGPGPSQHGHQSPADGWSTTAANAWISPQQQQASLASQQKNIWGPPDTPWKTTTGQVPHSPFSTFNFAANSSSLSTANSPWGVPANNGAVPFSAAAQSPLLQTTHLGTTSPPPAVATYASSGYAAALTRQQAAPVFTSSWNGGRQQQHQQQTQALPNNYQQQQQQQPYGQQQPAG